MVTFHLKKHMSNSREPQGCHFQGSKSLHILYNKRKGSQTCQALVHHNAAARNAAMHIAIFSHRNSYPFLQRHRGDALPCSSASPVIIFTSRTSPFRLCFHFSFRHNGLLYKQEEIYQESQRSDVATGNAGWPLQTQTQTQRCGALRCQHLAVCVNVNPRGKCTSRTRLRLECA